MKPINQGKIANPTQKQALLNYLKKFKRITTVDAMRKLFISNSATPRRIKDLIEDGWDIGYETKPYITHYGKKTRITEYRLNKKGR
jgi:hypothetical protein